MNSLLYSPTIKAAQEITLLQELNASKAADTAAGPNKIETRETPTHTQDTESNTAILNPLALNPVAEDAEQEELRRLFSTPIDEVASIAAEVADTASQLDEDDFEAYDGDTFPMFSHECFASSSSHEEPELKCDTVELTPESIDVVDLNIDDPLLEHFPSDRESIMATMRRVSATVGSDPTVVDQVTLSPVITARSSFAGNLSPMRESFGMDDENDTADEQPEAITPPLAGIASRQSLQSIVEGEETLFENTARDDPTPVQYIGPVQKPAPSLVSMGSDEGVSMNITPRKPIADTYDTETLHDNTKPQSTTPIADKIVADSVEPTEEASSSISSASKSSEQIDQLDVHKNPTNGERLHSPPSSMYSIHDNKGGGDWIHTFFRTMFVDWIGNFFCWLCSRSPTQV